LGVGRGAQRCGSCARTVVADDGGVARWRSVFANRRRGDAAVA
jgi:hypothetical protein